MAKKGIAILMIALLCLMGAGAASAREGAVIRVASLKGPTSMGLVQLMQAAKEGNAPGDYAFEMYGTADEIVTLLAKNEIDVAAVPCNLAAVLYQRLEGGVQVAAVNTLGVLYVMEAGDSVQSVADLVGKTIYTTGKGTTPEYTLRYVLSANGIDPDRDVTIEFKTEATELAAMLVQQANAIALVPQPYATTVQMQNENIRIALDLTAEWDAVQPEEGGSAMVTGVVLVRRAFAEENTDAFGAFLDAYAASALYANEHVPETAALVAAYQIAPEPVALRALPLCNIVFIEGEAMRQAVDGYLAVLFDQNPASVGGALPDEAFYYTR